MLIEHDIVVIGGGMAGASVAAHLAEHASVRLLEMEPQPGYHSTGRSAALFAESYGNATVRALTRASRAFFQSPPSWFCSTTLLKARAVLIIARTGQEAALEGLHASMVPGDEMERTSIGADVVAFFAPERERCTPMTAAILENYGQCSASD